MTNAERQKRYRDRKRQEDSDKFVTIPPKNVTKPAPNVTENPSGAHLPRENTFSRTASLEDYHKNPKDYALRGCAELLNWGPWMCESELAVARLSGNREAVPGDWDYAGHDS